MSAAEARQFVRLAMERLSGPERCALACAPAVEPLRIDELDHWSRELALEVRSEGRSLPRRPNPHDD